MDYAQKIINIEDQILDLIEGAKPVENISWTNMTFEDLELLYD
jgi:hypothetical protein